MTLEPEERVLAVNGQRSTVNSGAIEVFVAAGSNVEPERNLSRALAELHTAFPPLRVSPAYRNKAVGFAGADFINLVVSFETRRSVADVQERLQTIESLCGRPRAAPKWAPRSMDLDLLLYGALISSTAGLILPRPDLVQRAYMLKPIADLAPDLLHPTLQRTMQSLWNDFDDQHTLFEVHLPTELS